MALVAPARLRATLKDTSAGLEIVVPARRKILVTTFLGFWLCGWLAAEIMVPISFFRDGAQGPPMAFTAIWLVLWTLGGGFALYVFCWSLAGRERILLSPSRISIQREVFGSGRTREYDAAHVRDLRVSPTPSNPMAFRGGLEYWGIGGGVIAFDHGAATIRFGAGLEEGEAKSVVAQIKSRGLYA